MMKPDKRYFTNSRGKKINIFPGYFSLYGLDRLQSSHILSTSDKKIDWSSFEIGFFSSKYYSFNILVDFLKKNEIPLRFDSHLDIGSSHAIQSQLLKYSGIVKNSDAIDIFRGYLPLRKNILERYVKILAEQHKPAEESRNPSAPRLKNVEALVSHVNNAVNANKKRPVSLLSSIDRRLKGILPLNKMREIVTRRMKRDHLRSWEEKFGYVPDGYITRFSSPSGDLDNYLTKDIFTLSGKYDLITSFLTLSYFNTEKIIKKVSTLLDDGGVFAFTCDYWWYPINSTKISGDFPYACQRLERDDLKRYYEEFHPSLATDVMKRYDYYSKIHPTIEDYRSIGKKNGLTLVASLRMAPKGFLPVNNGPRGITPDVLDSLEDVSLKEILDEIHAFRPDVTLDDLKTCFILLVFSKDGQK